MIGIIFSSGLIKEIAGGIAEGEPLIDHALFYMRLACKERTAICFYALKHISLEEKTVKAYVYEYPFCELVQKKISIPLVNLYRGEGYLRKERSIHKIKELGRQGIIFLNAVTNKERSKYAVYKYLQTKKRIAPYLPETSELNFGHLQLYLKKYRTVFVKPRRGSKGNHIYIFRDLGHFYQVCQVLKQQKLIKWIPKNKLYQCYHTWFTLPRKYMIQQGIPLKEYKGNKFDIRVSPQKNRHNRWQVTGMIARIAPPGWLVTNLDQGGQAKSNLNKLIKPETKQEIRRLSLRIAKAIEKRTPQAIDLGVDFAVDEQERIWFLEVNFRPLRRKVWIRRHRTPFAYACSLYRRKLEEMSVGPG